MYKFENSFVNLELFKLLFRNFEIGRFIWIAVIIGVLPDLLSWGIYSIYRIFNNKTRYKSKKFGKPVLREIPNWVYTLYGLTHSIFVIFAVFVVIYIFSGNIAGYLLAWPLCFN